jgi:hypothetical protein
MATSPLAAPTSMRTPLEFDARLRWVLPSGNLGDTLLLSAVLRAGGEARGERLGMIRIPPYTSFFMRHPAIAQIATPASAEQPVLRTDHWAVTVPPGARSSAYARLSHMIFGCLIGEDRPWAEITPEDRAALRGLPFPHAPVLLCPAADPPGDGWPLERWAELSGRLRAATGAPIVLAGHLRQPRVSGAINVSGILQPRQILALVERAQAVIGVDPFLAEAARMSGTAALSLYDVAGIPRDIRSTLTANEGGADGSTRLASLSVEEVFGRVRDVILPSVEGGRPLVA